MLTIFIYNSQITERYPLRNHCKGKEEAIRCGITAKVRRKNEYARENR